MIERGRGRYTQGRPSLDRERDIARVRVSPTSPPAAGSARAASGCRSTSWRRPQNSAGSVAMTAGPTAPRARSGYRAAARRPGRTADRVMQLVLETGFATGERLPFKGNPEQRGSISGRGLEIRIRQSPRTPSHTSVTVRTICRMNASFGSAWTRQPDTARMQFDHGFDNRVVSRPPVIGMTSRVRRHTRCGAVKNKARWDRSPTRTHIAAVARATTAGATAVPEFLRRRAGLFVFNAEHAFPAKGSTRPTSPG